SVRTLRPGARSGVFVLRVRGGGGLNSVVGALVEAQYGSARGSLEGTGGSVESDEELAARRVGQIVGRYRLERVLGVGGMGAVYAARANDGSVAAIKVLHPEMSVRRDV